jgi:hypothetical protein
VKSEFWKDPPVQSIPAGDNDQQPDNSFHLPFLFLKIPFRRSDQKRPHSGLQAPGVAIDKGLLLALNLASPLRGSSRFHVSIKNSRFIFLLRSSGES